MKRKHILCVLVFAVALACLACFRIWPPLSHTKVPGHLETKRTVYYLGASLRDHYELYNRYLGLDNKTIAKVLSGENLGAGNPGKRQFLPDWLLSGVESARKHYNSDGEVIDHWKRPIQVTMAKEGYLVFSFGPNMKDDFGMGDDIIIETWSLPRHKGSSK